MKVEDGVDEEAEEEDAGGAAATWLIGVAVFSRGRPCLSKKVSANLATSVAAIVSTCFPIISLILGGIVLRRCSRRTWSTVTSLVSSVSCNRY